MDTPYKLYKGDCLEIMPTLEAGSVDAIITDLPYSSTEFEWDSVIDISDCFRILKKTGVFVTTANIKLSSCLISKYPNYFKNEWIWRKNNPVGAMSSHYQPMREHEFILVFSCGSATPNQFTDEKITYNPQGLSNYGKTVNGIRKVKTATNTGRGNKIYFQEFSGYPRSIIDFMNENGHHPTQKPVALYQYLIRTYTNEGETVLDITMGSGTTGVAAWMEGRKFIGIEQDPKYYSIAEKRISQAAQQPALFHAAQQSVNPTRAEAPKKFDNFE